MLSYILIEHWEYCTIYTFNLKYVEKLILKLYNSFIYNLRTRIVRQTEEWKDKMNIFNNDMLSLFDIFAENSDARKKKEIETGVTMGPMEWAFLDDQRSERKMYCEGYFDKVWKAQIDRRKKKEMKGCFLPKNHGKRKLRQ